MVIHVTVKTRARKEAVTKKDDTHYVVLVATLPCDGEANDAVTRALADYFDIAKSRVVLIKGHRSKQKTFEIK